MAILTKGPRGTQDVLPGESYKWQYLEKKMMETVKLYGFREIRIPTFEHTELFNRSVGDTTDVVQKEMYTFEDKGGRSITLRPEGTAGTLRSAIEHGLLGDALPVKAAYLLSAFRYEKPQAGRQREFHQFGVEMLGSAAASADAEVIFMVCHLFQELGIKARLELNSIGCPACRAKYQEALRNYFSARREDLCDTCKDRLERNPMRLLDCKSPVCQEIGQGAPMMLDFLCEECTAHFEQVKARLNAMEVSYTINPRIVRGLDYYTKTVFEFVSDQIGAQSTICAGGRYDGLIEQLGGPALPGIGFAMGLERILMTMEACGAAFPEERKCMAYIGSMGEAAGAKAAQLTQQLRKEGFWAECDTMGRSVKAQMKFANKLGARFSVILGDSELEQGVAKLKRMADGSVTEFRLEASPQEPGSLVKVVYDSCLEEVAGALKTE
ncbi:MAG: histidine--tRNA ligase [Oscillospiraceae bacterium]|nr:histidine--tRNA ligase [Oscillospiraceae bacterium]